MSGYIGQRDEGLEIRLDKPARGEMRGARVLQQVVRRPEHPAEGGQSVPAAGRDAADGQHHRLLGLHHRQRSSPCTLVDVSGHFRRRGHQDRHVDLLLRSSHRRSIITILDIVFLF